MQTTGPAGGYDFGETGSDRFEKVNATVRWTVAGDGLTEPIHSFLPEGKKMQTNLAGTCSMKDI